MAEWHHVQVARVTEEFGSGFSLANLKNFRRFFLVFPKGLHEGNIPAMKKATQYVAN